MHAEPESYGGDCAFRARSISFGFGNNFGSRLAIAQDSHNRSPSLNVTSPKAKSGAYGSTVTRSWGVEPKELLGSGVHERVTFPAQSLPLVGVL